jgi:hypothetical protein
MNLTNRNNFPEALVRAIANDKYSKGDSDFSVTELLQPPRIRALKIKHSHEIVEDVEDRLWSLYGQIVHSILERANEVDLVEKRFTGNFGDHTVSGQIDSLVLKDGILSDWKFSTAWAFKVNQDPKPEWTAQLNMQCELLRQNGIEVKKLQIVGLIRDWQIRDAKNNPDYPQAQVVTQNIEMWPSAKTQSFIAMRIALHKAAEKELPECSSEETWSKPDVYAVMKNTRAINGGLQFSEAAAKELQAKNPGTRIEFRKGEAVRCSMYCPVSEFCTTFKNQNKKIEENEDEVSRFA